MESSYTLKYFKSYLWHIAAIISNLCAMFIVVPKLSEMPIIYGIYSITISTSIFFNYADFGFISAGFKYSSESFSQGDRKGEIEIIGFSGFILFVFLGLCAICIFVIAQNPQIIIEGIEDRKQLTVASYLFGILSFSFPIVFIQRILRIIFGIRVEEYIFQRLSIAGSIVKILSVFYFFRAGNYNIVGYYLFFQLVNLSVCILAVIIAKKRYQYDFYLLLRSFRFAANNFKKTKDMALVTFCSSIAHVLFYEIDSLVIAKFLGVHFVAIYAIGFMLQSFIRNLAGVIYGPFSARFNHFIGTNNLSGLKSFYQNIVLMGIPIIVFPIISILLLMEPIVLCWVGDAYVSSILLARFLVACFIYSFLANPTAALIIAQERIRMLYYLSFIPLIIYWLGILLTFPSLKVASFAIFKFVGYTAAALLSLIASHQFLKDRTFYIIKSGIIQLIIPCSFMIIILTYLAEYLPVEKGKLNLLFVIGTGAIVSGISLILYYLISQTFRTNINRTIKKLISDQDYSKHFSSIKVISGSKESEI
jgi:O-antigen/teichoic acid export membrane protein